jgi:hypothetical protein
MGAARQPQMNEQKPCPMRSRAATSSRRPRRSERQVDPTSAERNGQLKQSMIVGQMSLNLRLLFDPNAGAQIAASNLYRRTGKTDRKVEPKPNGLYALRRQARFSCEIKFARLSYISKQIAKCGFR